MVHSADSLRLVETIDRIAEELQLCARLLPEVNASGDQSQARAGRRASKRPCLLAEYRNVEVCGLMCMAGLDSGRRRRKEFAELRQTRDRLRLCCPGAAASMNFPWA